MSDHEPGTAPFTPTRSGKAGRRSEDIPTRVLTVPQVAALIAIVSGLQALGGGLLAQAYVDSRIAIHNRAPEAHAGIMAAKADTQHDGDEIRRQLAAINDKIDATNQRLSRIEGALDRRGR